MNKKFFKFLAELFILMFIVYLMFVLIVKKGGMFVFDSEYASYKQTMDYVNNSNEYNKTLIFGDSVAKAGIIPNLISDDTYNISMAGATTIEQYYIMQDYLQNHEPPENLIMMYFMGAYDSIDDFFWNRTVYFDCLTMDQYNDLMKNPQYYGNDKFGMKIKFLEYKLCMPYKYYSSIKNAIKENRYKINKKAYDYVALSKGQCYFGTDSFYEPNNTAITNKKEFKVLDIIDIYMNKCIEQCLENDIQVIIEQHPINISTHANTDENYRKQYFDYMKSLKEKYPDIIVNCDVNIQDVGWFGDHSHLNERGATNFSKDLVSKYEQYLK